LLTFLPYKEGTDVNEILYVRSADVKQMTHTQRSIRQTLKVVSSPDICKLCDQNTGCGNYMTERKLPAPGT